MGSGSEGGLNGKDRTVVIDRSFVSPVDSGDLLELYSSVGWMAYISDPKQLSVAIESSSCVVVAKISQVF